MIDEISEKCKSRALEKKFDVAPGDKRSLFDAFGVYDRCGLRCILLGGMMVFHVSRVGRMIVESWEVRKANLVGETAKS